MARAAAEGDSAPAARCPRVPRGVGGAGARDCGAGQAVSPGCPRPRDAGRGGGPGGQRWSGTRDADARRGGDVEPPAAARPGPPPTPLGRTGALEGRRPQQRLLGGPQAPCPGHCGGGAPRGGGCSRHPAGRVPPAQLLHGNPREGSRVLEGGAAESPEGAKAEGRRVREAVPRAGAAGAGAGRADSQPVRGGPQNGAGGQREAGGSREAAKGGTGQDRHAAGGGDCPEDPGHHVHAGLPQPRAASATAEPHQGWAPQGTLAAPELQQCPGPHHAPCPRARPRTGQGGQGGRHHAVRRVPGLEGSAHTGQGLPLPGQGVPRGCGPLPGLHHARALCAGAGCRGGQHAHHRAGGLTHAAWHEGRHGVWPHQQVCPERADQPLPPPHPAWGLREPLLHLAILPGQDHSGVQLLHLHPLHPAGPGAAGRGADVLGGHEAAEGDVAGQAGLFPPGGLGHGLAGAAPALAQRAPSQSSKEGPVPALDGRTDRGAWSAELRPPPPPGRAHEHLPKAPWAEVLGTQEGTLGRAHPPLRQLSLPGREGQFRGSWASKAGSPCPSTPSTLGHPQAPASLPQGSRLGGHGPPPPCSVSRSGGPQAPPHPFPPRLGWRWGQASKWAHMGPRGARPHLCCKYWGLHAVLGQPHLDTPPHRAPPWLERSSICLIKEALLVGPASCHSCSLGSSQASGICRTKPNPPAHLVPGISPNPEAPATESAARALAFPARPWAWAGSCRQRPDCGAVEPWVTARLGSFQGGTVRVARPPPGHCPTPLGTLTSLPEVAAAQAWSPCPLGTPPGQS